MRDSEIYLPFMELLRAGLWNRPSNVSLFPITDHQWTLIRQMGIRQTVSAILYDGMMLLPGTFHPPLNILMSWTAEVEFIERRNRSMNQVVVGLHRFFSRKGITHILLKGQGLAAYYDQPKHRVCGDIDWYIPFGSDRKITERFLRCKGVSVTKQAGYSQMYVCKDVQVEHHSRLLDCHNPLVRGFLRELEEQEGSKSHRFSLCGDEITVPSPLLNHLQVNLHILKHMLSFGIGLRQLCDAARLYYSLHEQVNRIELEMAYRKLGVYRWIQVLNELLVQELGLLPEYLPFPREENTRYNWMMEEVWAVGNFGFHDSRYGGHDNLSGKRRNVWCHWIRRFRLHLYFAPEETLWFPVSHLVSRL